MAHAINTSAQNSFVGWASPILHIAQFIFIDTDKSFAWKALATLRSALYHSSRRIHFHILTNQEAQVHRVIGEGLEPHLHSKATFQLYGRSTFRRMWPILQR